MAEYIDWQKMIKHGYWERCQYNGFVRCSVCRDTYIERGWAENGKWKYCPTCGAKLEMESDEDGE